ncbi:uncharacterized protein LOC144550407 [Carex rostrata]
MAWTLRFPETAVFHLPRFQSDHLPILLRTKPKPIRAKPKFRCEEWWTLREGFKEVCVSSAIEGGHNWVEVRRCFKLAVKQWKGKDVQPDQLLKVVEKRMEDLLMQNPASSDPVLEKQLQLEHQRCLRMEEAFWHQRARVNWAVHGDRNTKFFHASAIARKRRNSVRALQKSDGSWITEEKGIRQEFVAHFKNIFQRSPRPLIADLYPTQIISGLPQVPSLFLGQLNELPTVAEIQRALNTLGPLKSAGPDGFHAKVIQENWEAFGPAITNEVLSFFETGVMPSLVARSNLVLIPKTDEAVSVTQFRPISVCNTTYKLISKILTLRMKPFINSLISSSQCAFLPGREISENIILFREVLHSFKQRNYKNKEFCLKLDLSKAFDRMDWEYLRTLLPLYGFPSRFTSWIMGCVTSAEFSLVFNGRGDGFFKPQCGLRQGCALSPYLFILGMDLLSRGFSHLIDISHLTGVRIARTAKPITNCLYADDLLIFGAATPQEVGVIMQNINAFTAVSGQQIGPDKSAIWFSHATPSHEQEAISQLLRVSHQSQSLKYLGAPILEGRDAYDFLIDAFSSRLQSWKGRLLSHAGRVILIKSVLQSIPVYHMSTTLLPRRVIKALTDIVRRFFWGKADRGRYMAYVAWDKITKPIKEGGLGIRDLGTVNEALLTKLLWRVAKEHNTQWVDIVRAKYFPRSLLWQSKRDYRCTIFWRAIMSLRSKLLPLLSLNLVSGDCSAFGQPWSAVTMQHVPQNMAQMQLKVKDLIDDETGCWDVQQLINCFGHMACMHILGNVRPPGTGLDQDEQGRDKLIFSLTANGIFSVKKMYEHLKGSGVSVAPADNKLWHDVWKKGNLQPRIRLFLWKLLNKAIPLGGILAARGIRADPTCPTCGADEESVEHLCFACPFSRACWFGSPLAIRTDAFQGSLAEVLSRVASETDNEQWTQMGNIFWALWRCRNEMAYSAKKPTTLAFQSFLQNITDETSFAAPHNQKNNVLELEANEADFEFVCMVDGSWLKEWEGGIGFVITHGTQLIAYRSAKAQVCSPLQAEATALKRAIEFVQGLGVSSCLFHTDSSLLAKAVSDFQPPVEVDWRAMEEIFFCWKALRENTYFICKHVSRCHNELADFLAKKGRIEGWDYIGHTYPVFLEASS